MAPEQVGINALDTDTRSDIYALGATLYMLLTSQEPPESVQRAVHDTLTPPQRLNPTLGWQVEVVMRKSLEKNPDGSFHPLLKGLEGIPRIINGSRSDVKTLIASSHSCS